jgi:hypothetical protein
MTRPYHSPSSIALGKRCPRAWAESYIAKKRDPDVDYFAVESFVWDRNRGLFVGPDGSSCTAKARGAALGKVMHDTLEKWYRPDLGKPNWSTHPGQVAQAGLHLLPHPTRCEQIITEEEIGTVPLPARAEAREGAPTRALDIGGILWAGRRDLFVNSPIEIARMQLRSESGWLLCDYKSSANIAEYAPTEAELLDDPQPNIYGIELCEKFGLKSLPARWVYFASKKIRAAEPRDVTIELSRAHDVMGPCVDLARELDTLTRVEDAPQNPLACEDYGPPGQINCEYHVSKGGTCRPRRTAGALIAQLDRRKRATTEKKQMALSPEQQAKFKAMQEAKKAAAGAPAAEPVTEPSDESKSEVETSAPEEQEAAPQAAAAPVKPTPAPVKPAAAKAPKGAAPGGTAATVAALAVELAAHEKSIADAIAAHASTLAKIRGAVA